MKARAIIPFLSALLFALPVHADNAEEPGKLAAVQQRKFRLDHEIFASANYQPIDAFYKGLGPAVGYTLHFSDTVAWEVVRGVYSFRYETSLRDQLKDLGVAPTKFDELEWMVSTAVMFTPFYGKLAMANHRITHSEIFFVVGGAVGKFDEKYKPGPVVGMGLRFFLSESVSMRAEGRYSYLFAGSLPSTQMVDLSLGLAINLGGTD